ncbi:MAG TPA: amidohydrolase family protein [Candidatus Acidoferrum sp.]|nr:amidohydrolase family protein [Candidatus Acidoferrum sp.]
MAYVKDSKSAAVRRQLDHPVIDGDGHWLEPLPIFLDYLEQVGGPSLVDHFKAKDVERGWYGMTPEERLDKRTHRPTWWGEPANALDRATAMVPKLFYERLDDFGVDFCLLYTSLGLFHINNADEQIRRGVSRAVNLMNAEMFAPYRDRIAPAAVVPVYTPEEAIEEATFAVKELGFKVIMISNHVKRPVLALAREAKDPSTVRTFIDSLAYESPYDYDKFWRTCVDLKVAVTAHSGSMSWHGRESVNNFTFNHLGHFAAASHAFARALIIGGVVKRFPMLRFGMLEGGVGWACNLFTDLVAHWEKRSRGPMERHLRPTNLDRQLLKDLFARYGGPVFEEKMDELLSCTSIVPPFKTNDELTDREYALGQIDDFEAAGVTSAEALKRQFADHFYFGAEADDPMTAWAFREPHKLRPLFSSDVSHFDVTDMSEVLEEAWELVEHGMITETDFRQFTFENAARLHTAMNPDFFKGTVVEGAVAKLQR